MDQDSRRSGVDHDLLVLISEKVSCIPDIHEKLERLNERTERHSTDIRWLKVLFSAIGSASIATLGIAAEVLFGKR